MHTTSDTLTVIIVCLALGATIGALLWDVLVADPLRRRIDQTHRRLTRVARQHQGTPYVRTGRPW